jgi:eukaryotic-like serine/threonine-protein kinase
MPTEPGERSGDFAVLPLMKKVVEIDPGFARAHHVLGEMYVNQGQATEGMEHLRRAFELRDRVSTREKYIITASYYRDVTGEFDKAREQYELWLHEYPREDVARNDFGNLLMGLGQYEKAVTVLQSAENPELSVYTNLIAAYGTLGRFREAKAALQAAFDKHFDGPILRLNAYVLAFSTNDQAGMQQQLSWAEGKPEFEEVLLAIDSYTQAYFGSLQNARSLATQAAQIAQRNGHGEAADRTLARMGLREALLGNTAEAIGSANQALNGSRGRDVRVAATLALALAGQTARARTLADGLEREFPLDTMMQNYFLPCIYAALQIGQKQPSKALQILERTRAYEMGLMTSLEMLSPLYLRGQALLLGGDSTAAAAEFHRILERPALMAISYLGPLAKLGLARAEALAISKAKDSDAAQAAKTRALAAYQEFLTLWKGADPDIPILKQAKVEYAMLKQR